MAQVNKMIDDLEKSFRNETFSQQKKFENLKQLSSLVIKQHERLLTAYR